MAERRSRDRPLPLFAWMERQRAARARRLRLRRRAVPLAVGIACLCATSVLPPLPRLVWNASPSAPIGLYAVSPGSSPARSDMAVAWPPAPVRDLAARRRYLPARVPLVKRVAGVAGDRVCAVGPAITINGKVAAIRRAADAAGRLLPWWRGCVRLGSGALFLLMVETPDSFDGRYFGTSEAPDIIGKATPLWLP